MIVAFVQRFGLYIIVALVGSIATLAVNKKLFTEKQQVDYSQIRKIVSDELQKLPKPEPVQGLDIEKIKGKGARVDITQNYTVQGDSVVIGAAIDRSIEKYLGNVKIKRR